MAWAVGVLLHDGRQALSMQGLPAPHCALVTHVVLSTGFAWQRWLPHAWPVPQPVSALQAFWHCLIDAGRQRHTRG